MSAMIKTRPRLTNPVKTPEFIEESETGLSRFGADLKQVGPDFEAPEDAIREEAPGFPTGRRSPSQESHLGSDPCSHRECAILVRERAGGTVRWGLRSGHAAWPDRSAPASAVREIALNG
jgi:hypothetical protein